MPLIEELPDDVIATIKPSRNISLQKMRDKMAATVADRCVSACSAPSQ